MLLRLTTTTILAATVLSIAGCGMMSQQNARYIYQDGEYGVIGIPQNSPYGIRDYRKQAEELMTLHFPEGHEIVRAEEVVEGQRVLDKSRMSLFETDPAISAFNQKIDLGKVSQTNSLQQKDSLPILESRIIYRRKAPEKPYGFSAIATKAPELYLDPNGMARCREKLELAELSKGKAALADKAKDGEVKQASATATAISTTTPPPADPKAQQAAVTTDIQIK